MTPGTSRRRPMLVIIGLAAVLAILAGACGGDSGSDAGGGDASATDCPVDALESADGPVEIALWHGVVGLTAKTLDQLAEEYNGSQDKVRVRVESQGTYEEQEAKYLASLRDPVNLPGILLAAETNTQFMIDSRSAVPAAACIEADPDAAELYDELMPAVKEGYSVQGTQWPGAFGVATPVLYYNRKHFTEAGLDPEKPPTTLEEIRSAAEAIKAVRPDSEPFVYRADGWWLENLSTKAGNELVNENNGRDGLADTSKLLNETTEEWTAWMQEMTDAGLQQTKPYASTFDSYLAVATQSASMLIETSTASTTVEALISGTLNADDLGLEAGTDLSGLAFPDLDIGVGELPGFEESGSGQVGGNAWYLVGAGKSPEEIAAAWDYMKWFNQTDNQVRWTLQGSYLPVFSDAAESPELQAYFADTRPGGWLATAFESLSQIDPDFPGPVIGPYKEFRNLLRTVIEAGLSGPTPLPEAFEVADAEFQADLDTYSAEVGG